MYVDGWMQRIEIPHQHMVVISRPDRGVMWQLDTEARTYRQAKLPEHLEDAFNPDMLDDWTKEGTEKIDGRRYLRFVARSVHPDRAHAIREVCFVDPKTHIRRRITTFDKSGKGVVTIDWLNVVVGPPPREVFNIPEGYKRAYHRRRRQ
jgi:hypothetical protein